MADDIEDLWWVMLGLSAPVFALFMVLLVWGLFRSSTDGSRTGQEKRSARAGLWLFGGGVLLPLVVLVVIMTATVAVMRSTPSAEDAEASGAQVIEVIGHQWWFEVRYPAEGVTVRDELHLSVGREVVLKVRSADVIHSFWVPQLAGKIDMLPEHTNSIVVQADRPGTFTSRCAEFCGIGHARMHMRVVAQSEEEFRAWLEGQR